LFFILVARLADSQLSVPRSPELVEGRSGILQTRVY